MKEILRLCEQLQGSPIAWAVLSIITVFAVVLSVIFYLKSKEVKEFSFFFQTEQIASKSELVIDDLEIMYKGQKVENFSVSKFIIWNSGNRAIRNSDIASDCPLQISCQGDAVILGAKIASQTSFPKFTLDSEKDLDPEKSKTVRKINFEFAGKRDGVKVYVFHTGAKNDLSVRCKIIDGKPMFCYSEKEKLRFNEISRQTKKKMQQFFLVIFGIFSFFLPGILSMLVAATLNTSFLFPIILFLAGIGALVFLSEKMGNFIFSIVYGIPPELLR